LCRLTLAAKRGAGESAINDNEGTVFQQIVHLEGVASTMREDLAEARAAPLETPGDERFVKQVSALESLLKGVLTKVERLRRQGQQG
jgi:hypothetical protein